MSFVLLFHYFMLNMFRMLIRTSSGACDLFVQLCHGLYCSGTMRVGVTVWFGWGGWCGIRMQAEAVLQVRRVLVLRCGLAGVVWYPDAS